MKEENLVIHGTWSPKRFQPCTLGHHQQAKLQVEKVESVELQKKKKRFNSRMDFFVALGEEQSQSEILFVIDHTIN